MTNNLFRKELRLLKPYIPGKPVEEVKRELGIDKVLKLASNENPLGPSPEALEAVKRELGMIHIYPDSSAVLLREALAEKYGLGSECIVVGNGGEQILQLIAQTFINAGDEAIMAATTFDMYASTVSFLGGLNVEVPLKDYKHDFKAFVNRINDRTKLIYVCNPNNPTGNIASREDVEYLIKNTPSEVVIVLDEAYYDYARINPEYPDSISILKKRPNTILLRTFSKVSGIAGVRVGFAITSAPITEQMGKVKGVFNVNRLAQAAALGALKDSEHVEKTVSLNYRAMEMMEESFEKLGLEYIKSNANFVFVNLEKDSRLVFQKLLEKGIIIRPGHIWGWNNWIRVSTGTIEQTKQFIEELSDLL